MKIFWYKFSGGKAYGFDAKTKTKYFSANAEEYFEEEYVGHAHARHALGKASRSVRRVRVLEETIHEEQRPLFLEENWTSGQTWVTGEDEPVAQVKKVVLTNGEYSVQGAVLTVKGGVGSLSGVYDAWGNWLFEIPATEEELKSLYINFLENCE